VVAESPDRKAEFMGQRFRVGNFGGYRGVYKADIISFLIFPSQFLY